jgi:hypothetical protein
MPIIVFFGGRLRPPALTLRLLGGHLRPHGGEHYLATAQTIRPPHFPAHRLEIPVSPLEVLVESVEGPKGIL